MGKQISLVHTFARWGNDSEFGENFLARSLEIIILITSNGMYWAGVCEMYFLWSLDLIDESTDHVEKSL